ncbi:hypothetical protein, partial [Micromonospora sp. NPDC005197]|uniref:hypothetical protein n=1 Tax=Micromonospora sp. NPDC005197 TaxID=3157020 RepID=UPI00339FC962
PRPAGAAAADGGATSRAVRGHGGSGRPDTRRRSLRLPNAAPEPVPLTQTAAAAARGFVGDDAG